MKAKIGQWEMEGQPQEIAEMIGLKFMTDDLMDKSKEFKKKMNSRFGKHAKPAKPEDPKAKKKRRPKHKRAGKRRASWGGKIMWKNKFKTSYENLLLEVQPSDNDIGLEGLATGFLKSHHSYTTRGKNRLLVQLKLRRWKLRKQTGEDDDNL